MSKLPTHLTWAVAQDVQPVRAVCVEAMSPDRIRSFVRRHPCMFITRPWAQSWDGQGLHQDEIKLIRNGIYRQLKRSGSFSPEADINLAYKIIEGIAIEHGIAYSDLVSVRNRDLNVTRARGHAAHALKEKMDLSLQQIAGLLHLKNHSCVRYWLDQPIAKLKPGGGHEGTRKQSRQGPIPGGCSNLPQVQGAEP